MKTLIAVIPGAVLAFAAAAQPLPTQAEADENLGTVQVQGERLPFDSQRPEYERMLPCIGCGATPDDADGIVMSVLSFVLLPSEPLDLRAYTPIVLRQPVDLRAERLP